MISVASQVSQLGDLSNYKSKSTSAILYANYQSKSTSVILCAVCGDVLSSVLYYHKHNITKHSHHELSLAIIKLCGLQLGQNSFTVNENAQTDIIEQKNSKQICISNSTVTDTNFECDSSIYKNKSQSKKNNVTITRKDKVASQEIEYTSREEIKFIDNITNALYNEDEKEQFEQLEVNNKFDKPENKKEDFTSISSVNQNQKDITSNNNEMAVTQVVKDAQYTNNKYRNENEKYVDIKETNINRVKIRKKKSISKTINEGKDLYEVVPSKQIKLQEDLLKEATYNETTNKGERNLDLSTNFGLNVCDNLVSDEVFLQPQNYTEETIPDMLQSEHTLYPSTLQENYFQLNSNKTLEYEHPQKMQQSEKNQYQNLLSHQKENVEEERINIKQEYYNESSNPFEEILDQVSYNTNSLSRSNKVENEYIEVKTEPISWYRDNYYNNQNQIYEDVECNDFMYNDEKMYDINTEFSNFSNESNESTYENETNFVFDTDKERDLSENICLPSVIHGIDYASVEESLQQSIQHVIHQKAKDSNKAKKSSEMESDDNFHRNKTRRKKKNSHRKRNEWLPRNRTKHRVSEKMRRMELNQQFDNLLKTLPEYDQRRNLPKNNILNSARKYVSKLKNINKKLVKEKDSLEEYQRKLIDSLSKSG